MMVLKYLTVLASKSIVCKIIFFKANIGLSMNKTFFCAFLFISILKGQLVDNKTLYKDLTGAVKYAYQNNLNVLIEDFTGVG